MLEHLLRAGTRRARNAASLAGILVTLTLVGPVGAQPPVDAESAVVLPARTPPPMNTTVAAAPTTPPAMSTTVAAVPTTPPAGSITVLPPIKAVNQPLTGGTISGFAATSPLIPQKEPKTTTDLNAFFENVSATDGMIEVVLGEGRLLTLRQDLSFDRDRPRPLIAVGDPSVLRVIPVSTRQLRLLGMRFGATDLSITTWDNRVYTLKVQVVADLDVLRVQLRAVFPDASLQLSQIHDHIVVEGQARDATEIARIIETIKAYTISLATNAAKKITGESVGNPNSPTAQNDAKGARVASTQPSAGVQGREPVPAPREVGPAQGKVDVSATIAEPQIINLIRVPGPQQVLLKVRVAELNRTALRQIGADILAVDSGSGAIGGTQIGGAGISALASLTGAGLVGSATGAPASSTSVFAIFQKGEFEFLLSALRRNSVLKILAEPNVVAMNGTMASFLAGGQFPVPVPQTSSGGAPSVTVSFQEFGVRLGFLPFILDGDRIRLTVDPEVSSVDFTIGTVLVPGGSPVPGLNTRKVHTTVELRQGQTLAIAGLMQLTLDGQTSRIPGLGDLPYIGPFFSNTSNNRIEKELIVLITPYLVEPMNPCQVPPAPGDDVFEPNDCEAYLLNYIEGKRDPGFRSTADLSDPLHIHECIHLEDHYIRGPHGFCD